MANSLSPSFADYWSRRMQVIHERIDVFRAVASFEEQERLTKGDVVHRPLRSSLAAVTYTRGTAVTIQDITDTDESLTVDQAKIVPFYVDDLDALQHNYRVINEYADDATVKLSNRIDGDLLGEYDQADHKVDNVEINGGTAGDGFTLTTANVQKTFAVALKKLQRDGKISPNKLFAIISADFQQVLLEYLAGKESSLGDSTGLNGHVGKYYGFDLYVSNSTGWSADLVMGSACTADDTIVINGVTLTAKASQTVAGEFDVEGSAGAQITTIVTFVNAPGTTTSGEQVALSQANQNLLANITATDATTKITFKAEGWGTVTVSETLTAAADVWTAAKQIQHNLFGQKGATDIVIQKRPNVEIKEVPDKLGKNILCWTLYGLKTFDEGDAKLVDVRVRSDAF